jgi:hypothetical protein
MNGLPSYQAVRDRLRAEYEELYYRFLQARRDYPGLDIGPEPAGHRAFYPFEIDNIRLNCEREFNRS